MKLKLIRNSLFGFIFLYIPTLFAQKPFSLDGHIENANGKKMFLLYYVNQKTTLDSFIISENKFHFSGTLKEPTWAALYIITPSPFTEVAFLIEPEKMNITLYSSENFTKMDFIGSKSEITYQKINRSIYEIYGTYLLQQYELKQQLSVDKGNNILASKLSELDSFLEKGSKKISPLVRQFIKNNTDEFASVYELYSYKTRWSEDTVRKYFELLSSRMKKSQYGTEIQDVLLKKASMKVGIMAPVFSFTDNNKKQINIKDFQQKKYVLLDFWASWCQPCISEFPDLKNFYAEFKKNVEIISLSTDENSISWKQALSKYKLPWIQGNIETNSDDVLNKKYITNLYGGVFTIPQQFLIDKNGIIVGIFQSSPLDMQKLKSLIK